MLTIFTSGQQISGIFSSCPIEALYSLSNNSHFFLFPAPDNNDSCWTLWSSSWAFHNSSNIIAYKNNSFKSESSPVQKCKLSSFNLNFYSLVFQENMNIFLHANLLHFEYKSNNFTETTTLIKWNVLLIKKKLYAQNFWLLFLTNYLWFIFS